MLPALKNSGLTPVLFSLKTTFLVEDEENQMFPQTRPTTSLLLLLF